ncbi:MAG TPA: transposase [Nitrospiraceae bacterium]|nr:transposase [Nitrospiraceae bacterium]
MVRTYRVNHNANIGKQDKITAVIKEYRKTAQSISSAQWQRFYKEGKSFNKYFDIKHIQTSLSERYKQTCQYQVVSILNSFISNRKNDFTRMVYRSHLPEQIKIDLFTINKYGWWFRKELKKIDTDTLKLARKIFKYILSEHRNPNFKNISMHLDHKVALMSGKVQDKATSFDYWVRLSTLDKNYPVYMPVKTNPYFENIEGKLKHFCQIGLKEDRDITLSFIKDVPNEKDSYKPVINKISLDTGLKMLFATDKGDLVGRNFYETLQKFDRQITKLVSNRQRQKLKVRCRKYDDLISKLNAYLKNEINRCLNKLVDLYLPAEIVVERLNFRNLNLSKRMNRLITILGKTLIKTKLQSLHETYRIKIIEINPAYTSQECSVCGYVDKNNRQEQEAIKCRFCNTSQHADVNGARNHLVRSSDEVINIYKNKKAVLHILVDRFLYKLSDTERKYAMPHSKAMALLSKNPYFSGSLAQAKGFL